MVDRTLPKLAVGLWLILKAPDKARNARRRAARRPPGPERDTLLAEAALLEWGSKHPAEATDQLEALWDRYVHPARLGPLWADWGNPSPAIRW